MGLTKAEATEIQRRVQDLDDPTRYLLVSDFGPRLKLYYDIENDAYVMNDPARATLFKRREAALAVSATLGKSIKLLQCTTRIQSGERVPVLPRGSLAEGVRERRSRRTRG